MKSQTFRSNLGFVLIEAMVALVVVAVGVLGIAKLSALLVRGTGETKTQAEALQIAQDRVERSRDFNMATGCASLSNSTEADIAGVNATYGVSTQFSAIGTSNARNIEVCVTWDGGSCSGNSNRIILRSSVMCDGMGTSAQVGAGGASGALGGFIKTPTGRGKVGGGTTLTPGSPNLIPGTSIADGTTTVTQNGTRFLTDATGNVLLSMAKLECETDVPEFSTISGTVFVEAKNGNPIASSSNLKVLSSDASYCAVAEYSNSRVMPENASGNSIKYFYTYYQCYVGAEWWGNIGLVRLDNANANNRVCQGSPANSNTGTIFSKHPQINSSRGYRGYREKTVGSGIYESKGIGETETVSAQCTGRKEYQPQFLRNHHFVHSSITGSVSDSACSPVLADLKTLSPPALLDSGSGAPTVTPSGGGQIVSATTNPGKFYCMSSENGVTCPDLISNVTPPSTLLHGTIALEGGATVTSINATELGTTCTTIAPMTTNPDGSKNYSCEIRWTGFIGTSWNGVISFDVSSGSSICPAGVTATVMPTGSTVGYTINDKDYAPAPNSISFSDIPVTATDITLNMTAKAGGCGVAPGQVGLNWVASGDPRSLSWTAITGATLGYQVETCALANATTCSSFAVAPGMPQSGTTFPPGDPGKKNVICVRVSAVGPGPTYGVPSTPKCVSRAANGNWTYGN